MMLGWAASGHFTYGPHSHGTQKGLHPHGTPNGSHPHGTQNGAHPHGTQNGLHPHATQNDEVGKNNVDRATCF